MIHVVLSGRVRIGKTTVCQAVIDQAQKRGYCVAGILTPALLDRHGKRDGIEVVDLSTGERRRLARVVARSAESVSLPLQPQPNLSSGSALAQPPQGAAALEYGSQGFHMGDYQFDATALQWGQDALARSIATGCDLLVMDEIGRLELEYNAGFGQVLEALQTGVVFRSLLVVRTELLDKLRHRLPELPFVIVETSEVNRRTLASRILDMLSLP